MHPLKSWQRVLCTFICCLSAIAAADPGLVVAMSRPSLVEHLTKDQVINIFMGRFRQLPNGAPATPIDQPQGSPTRAAFYRSLVNKTPAEIKAYWSRLLFSGKTAPPRQAATEREVIELLKADPNAVGYLRPEALDPDLRAVLNLEP